MMTKKCFLGALMVMCALTLHVNGQNANETLRQKYERLAKDADANPNDWQKQYDAAHMLIDKESELYDQIGAGKYYERIYHLVADVNPAVPDSVFTEAGITLMFNALNHQDFQNAIFYGDELKRFVRQKKDKKSAIPVMVNTMSVLMQMAIERPLAGADLLGEAQKDLVRLNFSGVENMDVTKVVLYEQVLDSYREFVKDKLLEVIIDGKPYVLIAEGLWNVEQPFMGWLADEPGGKTPIFLGEDGRVYDDLHGQILFNYNWSEKDKGVVKSEDTNTRLITVTPERRQQMIEAYRKYVNK